MSVISTSKGETFFLDIGFFKDKFSFSQPSTAVIPKFCFDHSTQSVKRFEHKSHYMNIYS